MKEKKNIESCLKCKWYQQVEYNNAKMHFCERLNRIINDLEPCVSYESKEIEINRDNLSNAERELLELLETFDKPIILVSLEQKLIGAYGKLKSLGLTEESQVLVNTNLGTKRMFKAIKLKENRKYGRIQVCEA